MLLMQMWGRALACLTTGADASSSHFLQVLLLIGINTSHKCDASPPANMNLLFIEVGKMRPSVALVADGEEPSHCEEAPAVKYANRQRCVNV